MGAIRQLESSGVTDQVIDEHELVGKVLASNVTDSAGIVVLPLNTEMEESHIEILKDAQVTDFSVLFIDGVNVDASFRNTLTNDKIPDENSREEAIIEIYKRMRPGEPPALEPAETLFNNLFFDGSRYDLSAVGRIKLNERLELEHPVEQRTLTKEDILRTVDILLKLKLVLATLMILTILAIEESGLLVSCSKTSIGLVF